jgi:hypothetical protein
MNYFKFYYALLNLKKVVIFCFALGLSSLITNLWIILFYFICFIGKFVFFWFV